MVWQCAAVDHGVTVFPDGRIGPCCQIGPEYLKSIELIRDPNRFQDLKTDEPPSACRICVDNERSGISSYRDQFNRLATEKPGLQFLDIRNTNVCNLKCRYCGPHFSNQWAMELNHQSHTISTPVDDIIDLADDSLQWLYFTGGEPMINPDHWSALEKLIERGLSRNIELLYNSNLSTIKYKDVDVVNLWKQFRNVRMNVSIDAVGEPLSYIRSGSDWERIKNNITRLKSIPGVDITLTPVISILNIWFLVDLYNYAKDNDLKISAIILHGPDYLALDVIPDGLQQRALSIIDEVESLGLDQPAKYQQMRHMISHNSNHCLFQHTLNHILLLDQRRSERLFDLLPFGPVAQQMVLENHEYQ